MIEEEKSLLSEDGIRLDGRKVDELRPITIEVGVLKRADGSAEIKWGNNKIVVAVYGPRELHPKHLAQPDRAVIRCEYRLASFSVDERKSPAPKRREIELSKIIAEALMPALFLESYPKASIDVYVQVLNADGGTRCAAIVASAVALADAGIPMRSLVTAVAVGKANGQIILDLSDVEDKEGGGDIPVAIIQNTQEISLFQADGIFTAEEIKKVLELAIDASKQIFEIQKEALTHKFRKFEIEAEESEEEVEITEEDFVQMEPNENKGDEKEEDYTLENLEVVEKDENQEEEN